MSDFTSLSKIFYILNLALIIILVSCKKNQPAQSQNNISSPDTFNIRQLNALIDSLNPALFKKDTNKIEEIVKTFNNVALSKLNPDLVFHAYYTAYAGSADFEMADLKEFERKQGIFYIKFTEVAAKTGTEEMFAYAEYIKGRTLNELNKNDLAFPLLLRSLEKFQKLKQGYGYSLTAKRIGMCYMNSYRDFYTGVKYLKLALPDTFDFNNQARCYQNIIKCYFNLQQYDSLHKYVAEFIKKPSIKTGYYENFTKAHFQIFRYAYNLNGNSDSVDLYFNPLLKLHTEFPVVFYYKEFMEYCTVYCSALLLNKQYKRVSEIVNKITDFENTHQNFIGVSDKFYEICYRYYEIKDDVIHSNYFLKRYIATNKKLEFEVHKRKIELARIDYETKKEKQAFYASQIQQEILNQQQLQKQKIIRNSFIAGAILLLLLIVLLINRNKLKRTVEIEKMRSRLSRDLHDDIGSTLSSINILSRTAQGNLQHTHDEKTKASLEKINERSQRLLDNMSDIIWNINPSNDTIEEVMSRMREYATTILEAKNIDYAFDFPKEKMDCKLTMEVKNNMYLIFKEAVNNLSKYSGATYVILSLTFDEKNIRLKVEDNGKGFIEDEINHNGGLRNMRYRAEEIKGTFQIQSIVTKGTTMELVMPRFC